MTNKEVWLGRYSKAALSEKDGEILKRCEGKRVLDVGCVGQVKSYKGDEWLHGKISKVANDLVGVDIDREGVLALKKEGHNVFHLDDLSPAEWQFEVVVMGDVIEHIGDVQAFLSFYKEFLSDEGEMIITTPNPFNFRQLMSVLLFKEPSVNAEHTCWLDPITLTEVFDRSGLKIKSFLWLKEYSNPKTFTSKITHGVSRIFYAIRRFYSPNFMFVVGK